MSKPEPGDLPATATGVHAGADLAPGTVLASRFVIERLLGIGGMGVVYRARDQALGVTVALKLLRPELASRPESFERFRQELLLARQVSSPQVVRIHDIARHQDRWFISMDFVDGESLDKVLDRRGPLPVEEALAITRQLAEGLGAAHASGVVHRDLKPSNVLIDQAGNAHVSDFGVARSLGSSGLTQSGAIVGTPDYLSPEQARAGSIDGRSDLYALGLILYEMLAGRPAFGGGTPAESLSQRMIGPPTRVDRHRKDTPAWVARLIDRLLRPNPAHRLPDAAAVIAAIDRRSMPRDLRPSWRGGALAALLAATIAGVAWWSQRLPAPAPSAPVPDRLVVLAEPGADADEALLLAVAEHLRQGLAQQAGVPVVDGERTQLAQERAGFGEGRGASDAQLLEVLPATRVLRLRVRREPGGYVFSGQLNPMADGRHAIEPLPAMSDPLQAARAFATRASQSVGAAAFPEGILPADGASLSAYGRALQLRRAGRAEQAAAAFVDLTRSAPAYGPAWLGLVESAKASGQRPLALEGARSGLALGDSPLRAEFSRWLDLLEGRVDAALLQQRERVGKQPDDLDARLVLADTESEAGEFEKAITDLQGLVARDEHDPRAWFLLGKASILHGEPRQAVENQLVRALVLFKRSRSRFGEAETTNALGVGYARLGQTEDAEEQYRKAVALRRELGDRRGTASSLRNLAQLATIRRRFDEAQGSLDEARALFEAIGDTSGGAAVDNELGLLAEERGNYQAALDAYRRALRGRERIGDAQGSAESLNNIGFAHYQLGDYADARAFWRQAREAFVALDDHNGIIRADQNLGLLEMARGGWIEARKLLESSLQSAESRHMHEEAAVSRRNLAELDLLQSRLAPARAHLQQARALFTEREDERGLIDADLLEARLLACAGAGAEALALLTGIQPRLDASSPEQRAIAALLQAGLHAQDGDAATAARLLASALDHGRAAGVPALQLQAQALALASAEGAKAEALSEAIANLGNLPLQLAWAERRIDLLLAAGRVGPAVAAYAEATELLVGHEDYVRAAQLHRLGARALAGAGRDPESARATAAATKAQERLEANRPVGLGKGASDGTPTR